MKAVILAGGHGTRLRPYTTNFPKPLMPVGDVPILEILLRQLRSHGIVNVTLMSGHLAYMIEAYFGDGTSLDMKIRYVRESEPRGTAGPLRALVRDLSAPFLVLNGDLLTDLDFTKFAGSHHARKHVATVAVYRQSERIDLGVVELKEEDEVVGYREKPVFDFDVSMGAYVFSPEVLAAIPDRYFDMPDLILDLLAGQRRVGAYRHAGLWLDIGRSEDYGRANDLFREDPSRFLGKSVNATGSPTR